MLLYGNERDILPKLLQFEMTADIMDTNCKHLVNIYPWLTFTG
jgi:hypothetical protein